MSYTQDINETTVFTALRAFIQNVIGTSVEVVRIPTNRVPMPKLYPFITMSPLRKTQIAWPTVSNPSATTETIMMPTQYLVQVDGFGPTAGDLIQTVHAVLQTADAFDFFAAQTAGGVYPIYANDPKQVVFVDEEDQMAVRWIMEVNLQYTPTLTSTVQTASTVTVGTITNIEAAYH